MALTSHNVNEKLHSHEEICAIRYDAIHHRLDKLERLMMKAIWSTMTIMSAGLGALFLILLK
jgi:hypothetical protein